jgi:hypothetical protein
MQLLIRAQLRLVLVVELLAVASQLCRPILVSMSPHLRQLATMGGTLRPMCSRFLLELLGSYYHLRCVLARVQVKTRGADLVARKLIGHARAAEDIRPAQPAVARRVAAGYGRSFDRSGPGWPGLKPSTIRRRAAEGYSTGHILVKTGKYRAAATNPMSLKIRASRSSFLISVDYDVSKFHQTGTKFMPPRRLTLSFGDVTALVREISEHLMDGYRHS